MGPRNEVFHVYAEAICSWDPCEFPRRAGRNHCSRVEIVWQVVRPAAPDADKHQDEGFTMLGWVVTFLVIALIAGILGFGGIAGASIEIAKIIFFIAVVLFLVSAVVGLARCRNRV
jgi:uncharacterized membrane protein YtjA (UPF0391 family)